MVTSAKSMNDRPRFALRFISGKYQGGEFPLRMNREIIIGRSSDLDMVLVEDMVSRRHAKISSTEAEVYIQDMGSTNGTFVNGEKIAGRALLHEGDRILVGTSIIKVVAVEGQLANQSEAEARRRLEAGAQQRQATQGRPMSGVIEEIPLPDLLQLLSTSRKSGVLTVNNGVTHRQDLPAQGRDLLRDDQRRLRGQPAEGDLPHADLAHRHVRARAAACELQVMEEVQESTEALLMEGVRQLDEFRNLQKQLPPLGSPLAVPTPLAGKLRELSPSELDTFQLVLDHGQLQKVLDNFPGTDLDAAQN